MTIRKTKNIRQTKKCAQCSMYSLFCFVNIYFPSFEDVLFLPVPGQRRRQGGQREALLPQ